MNSSPQLAQIIPFYSHLRTFNREPNVLACLSHWYSSPLILDGVKLGSAEHGMMHGKALLFGDTASALRIAGARTALEALELGRGVRGFDETLWVARRRDIVFEVNLAKFQQNAECARVLLETGEALLAFASPHDLVWGTGYSVFEHQRLNARSWSGENLLGRVLMEVRGRLQE